MSGNLSLLRQKLWRAYAALARTLRQLQRAQPMVQGSFYWLRRQCGKPHCRCAAGQLHASWVLTRSEAGKDRIYSVPKDQRAQVRQWALMSTADFTDPAQPKEQYHLRATIEERHRLLAILIPCLYEATPTTRPPRA